MKTLNLIQNSQEWLDTRSKCFCASEAAAMMSASKYQTRDDLLKIKATGIAPEVDSYTQSIFNKGHEAEAAARPFVAEIIGEELFPVTGFLEVDGLPLLASFDGLTFDESIGFEHKLWNEKLVTGVREHNLELHYVWQLEQQLLISGADKIIFVVSDGTKNNFEYLEYYGSKEMQAKLIAGWKQFKKDLENYTPVAQEPIAPVAEYVEQLPALTYKLDLTNGVALTHNLDVYKSAALDLVEDSKKELNTDQDFANAEKRVKVCKEAENNIKSLIQQVLGEITDVNNFKTSLEAIGSLIAEARKNQEKKITSRKEAKKTELIQQAKDVFDAFFKAINAQLSPLYLPPMNVQWVEAIKGKSSFDNMRAALNGMIATKQAEVTQVSELMQKNHDYIKSLNKDFLFSIHEVQEICTKPAEHAKLLADKKVSDYLAAQEKLKEAERLAEIEKQKEAEKVAPAQESIIPSEMVDPVETITHPNVYEEYEQIAPQPLISESNISQGFTAAFSASSIKFDQVDPVTIKLNTLEYVLKLFEECEKNKELDFKAELLQMINATKLPRKVA
jgi:predicted phage-related endonuclease